MFSLDFIKLMLCMKPAHQFKIWWAEMRKKIEAYPKPSQTSKMDLFAKIVNGFHLLTNFVKSFILNVWLGSECASRGGYSKTGFLMLGPHRGDDIHLLGRWNLVASDSSPKVRRQSIPTTCAHSVLNSLSSTKRFY